MEFPVLVTAKPSCLRKTIKGKSSDIGVPEDLHNDPLLNKRIREELPENYNFELHKVIWRIRETTVNSVALQFPEGLFIFSTAISSIIEEFSGALAIIIGDVTYGACCVDDYLTSLAQCQLLIHFGHSCLVPSNMILTNVKVIYVTVKVDFDHWHFVETFKLNFESFKNQKIAICSTVQFISSLQKLFQELKDEGFNLVVPQIRPLSRGEILGCTAPSLDQDIQRVVFVADGRFHLEAVMIANSHISQFYRYNPYDKLISYEIFDYCKMIEQRSKSIHEALRISKRGGTFGFILGTLGRQGSPKVLQNLIDLFKKNLKNCSYVTFLIPEIKPQILQELNDSVDVFVQTSCPRLSVDWGDDFIQKPMLNPYEFNLLIKSLNQSETQIAHLKNDDNQIVYPMDFYASSSHGGWTPIHKCNKTCSCE